MMAFSQTSAPPKPQSPEAAILSAMPLPFRHPFAFGASVLLAAFVALIAIACVPAASAHPAAAKPTAPCP